MTDISQMHLESMSTNAQHSYQTVHLQPGPNKSIKPTPKTDNSVCYQPNYRA